MLCQTETFSYKAGRIDRNRYPVVSVVRSNNIRSDLGWDDAWSLPLLDGVSVVVVVVVVAVVVPDMEEVSSIDRISCNAIVSVVVAWIWINGSQSPTIDLGYTSNEACDLMVTLDNRTCKSIVVG